MHLYRRTGFLTGRQILLIKSVTDFEHTEVTFQIQINEK